MKKLIIYLAMMVMLVSFVNAGVFGSDVYYKLEDETEEGGGTSFTLTDSPPFVAAKLNNGISCDGALQEGDAAYSPGFTNKFTINFWVKYDRDSPGDTDEWPLTLELDSGGGTDELIYFTRKASKQLKTIGQQNGGSVCWNQFGGDPLNAGVWYMITLVLNGVNQTMFVNGTQIVQTSCNYDFSGLDKINLCSYYNDDGEFDGTVDDLIILPTDAKQDWIDERWNNGVGAELTGNVSEVTDINGSILAADLSINDVNLTSSDFIPVISELFNMSGSHNITLFSALDATKLTGGGTNTITARIILDGTLIKENEIRTVSTLASSGVTGIDPFIQNITGGQHNITVQFSRSGNGVVALNNIDAILIYAENNDGDNVGMEAFTDRYTHETEEFILGMNFSTNKLTESNTFLNIKSTLSKSSPSGASNYTYFINSSSGKTSPFWARLVTSVTELGSTLLPFIDNFNRTGENYTIMSQFIGTGTATANISAVTFDLEDINNHSINHFQKSNITSNQSGYSLAAGSHRVLNVSSVLYSGDTHIVAAGISIKSDDSSQDVKVILNGSGCTTEKDRTLSSSNDIGNIFLYLFCEDVALFSDPNYGLYVENTNAVHIIDEIITGFDVAKVNTSLPGLPPVPPIVLTPSNTSHSSDINISYSEAFALQGKNISYYNITLLDSSSNFVQTINGNNSLNLSFLWDITGIADGSYIMQVAGCDTDDLCSADQGLVFLIENINPDNAIVEPQDNQIYTNASAIFSATCNDSNLFGFDFAVMNESDVVFKNSTRDLNTTFLYFNNTMDFSTDPDSLYDIQFDCLDGHTASFIDDVYNRKGSDFIQIGDFTVTTQTRPDKITYDKRSDRYKINIEYSKENTYSLMVSSPKKIYERKGSNYKGHLVTGSYWFDTEPYTPKDIIKINDNLYQINIEGSKFNFDSIGIINNASVTANYALDAVADTILNISPPDNALASADPPVMNFTWNLFVEPATVENCSVFINGTRIQTIDSGINAKGNTSMTDVNLESLGSGNYTYLYSCFTSLVNVSKTEITQLNTSLLNLEVDVTISPELEGSLSLTECPTTTSGILALGLIVVIALFFIAFAIFMQLGFMGFFGSIMLMVVSWYIAPCQSFFALIMALFSFILLIWFVMISFKNN